MILVSTFLNPELWSTNFPVPISTVFLHLFIWGWTWMIWQVRYLCGTELIGYDLYGRCFAQNLVVCMMNPAIFNNDWGVCLHLQRDRNGYNVSDSVVIMSLDCLGESWVLIDKEVVCSTLFTKITIGNDSIWR